MVRQITTDPQHLGCNPRRLLQMHQLRGILLDIRDIRVQVDIQVQVGIRDIRDIRVDNQDILRVLLDRIQTLRPLQGLMDILQ